MNLLEIKYDLARKKLRDAANTKVGNAGAALEATYSQAYQQLVKAGLRPQLKGKYRG